MGKFEYTDTHTHKQTNKATTTTATTKRNVKIRVLLPQARELPAAQREA